MKFTIDGYIRLNTYIKVDQNYIFANIALDNLFKPTKYYITIKNTYVSTVHVTIEVGEIFFKKF